MLQLYFNILLDLGLCVPNECVSTDSTWHATYAGTDLGCCQQIGLTIVRGGLS
jgi:hypothetical protein